MTQNPLDTSVFDGLKDAVGAEFAAELLDTFFEEAPGMLAELQAAFDAQDADAFRRAAHSIKSNASTFGATALSEAARLLEIEGMAGAADAMSELNALYQEAAGALEVLKNA